MCSVVAPRSVKDFGCPRDMPRHENNTVLSQMFNNANNVVNNANNVVHDALSLTNAFCTTLISIDLSHKLGVCTLWLQTNLIQ